MNTRHRILRLTMLGILMLTMASCDDDDTTAPSDPQTDLTDTTGGDDTHVGDTSGDEDVADTSDPDTTDDGDTDDTDVEPDEPPEETFVDPSVLEPDANGVLQLTFEPAAVEIEGRQYCLRTFNGLVPAPTWRIPASSSARQVRVDYTNTFTTTDTQVVGGNATYDFNHTNLHTHGFHVWPNMNPDGQHHGDDVLIHLMQGESASYRYDIDEFETHEAGTFWYHPHVHGATAIQVANGMAGAIIIEGDYDALPGLAEANERIFVMQHIAFEAATPLGAGESCSESNLSLTDFRDVAGETPTLVNGVRNPRLVVAPGSVEHWRLIHGGVTHEMELSLRQGLDTDCTSYSDNRLDLQQIAVDSIALPTPELRDDVFLATGNRADLMVKAPDTEGTWCFVRISPGAPGMPDVEEVVATLTVDARAGTATGALVSEADLASVATPPLDCDAPVDSTQDVIFAQQTDPDTGEPCEGAGGMGPALNINCKQHDPDAPRILPFEAFEAWNVTSEGGPHPMHIHINPFTVCGGTINGEPVTTPHWRDTLLIDPGGPGGNQSFDLRMEYEHYTGDFVMHCHKLQHEDSGMMEKVSIQPQP